MPGYRSLSANLAGTAAEHAREAELHQRDGDPEVAARLLEEALEASLRVRPEMPGWICGRLASIYRTLKRYDDEVELLERYRESQTSEEARTRFDARLSKARAIAERKRRPVTGALETVRQVRHRSSLRRRAPSRSQRAGSQVDEAESTRHALCAALLDVGPNSDDRLRSVLAETCVDARSRGTQIEHLVTELKAAWSEAGARSPLDPEAWHDRYSAALVHLLALYFGEPPG